MQSRGKMPSEQELFRKIKTSGIFEAAKNLGIDKNEFINSKSAEVNAENEELIKLIDVTAVIYLKERSPIYIESDYTIHNKNVFDTKFYDNVNIRHDKIKISSGNLDLIYNSNLVSLYNITEIYDNNTQLIADKIDFDINISGNIQTADKYNAPMAVNLVKTKSK